MARITLSREETLEWLHRFHEASASLDENRWLDGFWAEDAKLTFSSLPPLKGRDTIKAFFRQQFGALAKMEHNIVYFDIVNETIYQKTDIVYLVKGKSKLAQEPVEVPAFAVFRTRLDQDGITRRLYDFEVYLDPAPLTRRIQEVQMEDNHVIDLLE